MRRQAEFVHLDVHSAFSLGAGVMPIERLVARASAEGHEALALTDTDGAYAMPLFEACCRALDVAPLHGAEIHGDPARDGAGDALAARVLVLVENETGYANLSRLLAARHGATPARPAERPFALIDFLPEHMAGLVVLVPSPHLLRALARDLDLSRAEGPLLAAECVAHESPERRAALCTEAKRLGLPVVGTHRVFLERPTQHDLHRTRLAIAHLAFWKDVVPGAIGRHGTPIDLAPPTAWLMPPARAAACFRHHPEAARATLAIRERLVFRLDRPSKPRLPELDARQLGLASANVSPTERREAAYGRLAAFAVAGMAKRYERLSPERLARLEKELRVIEMRGFSDYFLIVHELVRFAQREGIPVVGRGSAASSIVAYALGITSVDPLRYDLPFERFLSPERSDCPDIDLDIDWRGREAVIRHVYGTYGEDRVAMISTHVAFQARSAVREVGRTQGLEPTALSRLTAHLPHRMGNVLSGAARAPELADLPLDEAPWRGVIETALALDGLPRHLGLHVGGIVIGDGDLASSLPLQRSADGRVVTQFDMHGVEATGLVKIDLLGNRALAVVADVVREVGERDKSPIDLEAIAEDDHDAAALLRTGRTLGCFQVESPGMRNLVVRMQACSQEDAMVALSLIRPGPAGSGMKDAYIRRRRGEEEIPHVHPLVDPLFARTHGVMLYQEDTLRVAAAVAGFDLAQADRLRRALSKKRLPEDLPAMEDSFREGARGRGVPAPTIDVVWQAIVQFSAYAYNKAHAATYARISWQGLWLKARHPAEWMAAVLRNEGGFYAPRVYVEEARRQGCKILGPCINASLEGAVGRKGSLRLGLGQVKGLREGSAKRLVEARQAAGPFLSLSDLLLRTELERAEAERLVLAGALDLFDRPRGELLWMLMLDFERYMEARFEQRDRLSLFGATAMLPPHRHIPVPPSYTTEELLALEADALGLSVSCHPLEPWQALAQEAGATPTDELVHHIGSRVSVAGWVVSDRRVRVRPRPTTTPSRHGGSYMKFLMLEDPHGTVEVTLFPRTYAAVGHLLVDPGPYLVVGRVQDDHGSLTLDAEDIERLR